MPTPYTNPFTPRATWTGYRGLGSLVPLEILNLDAKSLDLDNCGSPIVRPDLYVEFPLSYVFAFAWTEVATKQFFLDERRPVSARGDFILDRTCGVSIAGVRTRFIWPSGRFSANTRIPTNRYFDTGDDMGQFLDPIIIPAGQWIGVEIEIDASTAANEIVMSFDGRVRYYLQHVDRGQ